MATKTVKFDIELDASGAIKGVKGLDDQIEKLDDSIKDVDKSTGNYRDAQGRLRNENGKYIKDAKRATTANDELGGSFEGIGAKGFAFANIISEYAVRALDAVIASIGSAIEIGSEYQANLAELSAITGIAGEDLDRLGDTAISEAARTGVAISDQIEAYKLLASNIDVSVIGGVAGLEMLGKATVQLAQASGVDLATAANTVAGAINQFGLEASQASDVVNILAAGSKFGAAFVDDLGESLKNVGSIASISGLSLEDTVGTLEVLSQQVIKGAEAGTGLRNVLLRLQAGSAELAELGITPATLKTQGLAATMALLEPIMDDTQQMNKIFGEGAIVVASALAQNSEQIAIMTERVTGTKTALEQAIINSKTFTNAQARMSETIDGLLVKSFLKMEPFLVRSMEFFITLADNASTIIPILTGVSLGIGFVAIAFNAQAIAASIAAFATSRFGLALSAALGPISLIIGALGGLIGYIASQEGAFSALGETISGFFQMAKGFFANFVDTVINYWSLLGEIIIKPFDLLWRYVKAVFNSVLDSVKGVGEAIGKALVGDFEGAAVAMLKVGADVGGNFSEEFEDSFDSISTAFNELKDGIIDNADVVEGFDRMTSAAALFGDIMRTNAEKTKEDTEATKANVKAKEDAALQALLAAERESEWNEQEKNNVNELDSFLNAMFDNEQERFDKDLASKAAQKQEDASKRIIDANLAEAEALAAKINIVESMTADIITSNAEQAESFAEAGAAIINDIRLQIRGVIAQAIANQAAKVLSMIPPPFSIPIAAAAGAAASVLFNKLIPSFETGGMIGGQRHSAGGTLIEAEQGEFVVNRNSTSSAPNLIEAINSSATMASQMEQAFSGSTRVPDNSSLGNMGMSNMVQNIKVTLSLFDLDQGQRQFNQVQIQGGVL